MLNVKKIFLTLPLLFFTLIAMEDRPRKKNIYNEEATKELIGVIESCLFLKKPIDTEKVKNLITSKNANVNAEDAFGATILHAAVSEGSLDLISFLCDQEACLNKKTCFESMPLHYAICSDQNGIRINHAAILSVLPYMTKEEITTFVVLLKKLSRSAEIIREIKSGLVAAAGRSKSTKADGSIQPLFLLLETREHKRWSDAKTKKTTKDALTQLNLNFLLQKIA